MEKQLIISISREYGSGGHLIAEKLAKIFELPIYDHNLIDHVFDDDVNVDAWKSSDEKPRTFGFSRSVSGCTNSSEHTLAQLQFQFLKDKAKAGESFVVVGRCSEMILREFDGLIPIFVLGDRPCKIKRLQEIRGFSEKEAKVAMARHDKYRKRYHNSYCDFKWGDSRG